MKPATGLALLWLVCGPAWAAPDGLPPEAEVEQALSNYPGVAAALQRVAAARAEADVLRAGPHEFILSGGYARRDIDREGRYGDMDATLSRAIRLPGKAGLDRKAGTFGITAAENRSGDARHQAALVLAQLWYDWVMAGELFRNADETAANHDMALEAIERRVTQRDAALLEADQARAALAAAQAQRAEATALLEKARATLQSTFPEIVLANTPPPLPAPDLPADSIDTLRQQIVEHSHEIRAAEAEAQRMSATARRAQLDRIPDPTIGMRAFRERSGIERGVGVTLSIPLGWDLRRAEAARAGAQASAAGFDALEVRRQVQAVADGDAAEARTRLTAWSSMRTSAESAGTAAARTQRGYEIGAIDLADLLLAQRQAYEARRAEILSRTDAARAVVKLMIDAHAIWAASHDAD